MTKRCYAPDSLHVTIFHYKCYGSDWTNMTSFVPKIRTAPKG